MYHYFLLLFGILFALPWSSCEFNQQQVDEIAEAIVDCRDIVGMNLAVVHNGETVYTTGYGYSYLGNSEQGGEAGTPVTKDTLFGLASVSKAFASTLLGKMLDKHPRFTWDTPVRDILGEEMFFPSEKMTTDATLRDLLSHKTGLSPSNSVRYDATVDREELVRRIRFIPSRFPFRTGYLYNNLMYGLISRITEVIGGATWEELMRDELFLPLEMTSTDVTHEYNLFDDRVARPYLRTDENEWRNVSLLLHSEWGKLGGSGSVLSSAEDIANWLKFQLSKGRSPDGDVVVSEEVIEETHTAFNNIPATDSVSDYIRPKTPVTYTLLEYGLGWRTGYYRGYPLVSHTGTSWGYGALLTLVPDLNIGIHTSVSGIDPSYRGRRALHLYIMDQLMNENPWLNISSVCSFPETNTPRSSKYNHDELKRNSPSKPLVHYTGTYGNFAYGNITVEIDSTQDMLRLKIGIIGDWLLHPLVDGGDSFRGVGEETVWSSRVNDIIFSRYEGEKFQNVTLSSFDRQSPPEFIRHLRRDQAPDAPILGCPDASNASIFKLNYLLLLFVAIAKM